MKQQRVHNRNNYRRRRDLFLQSVGRLSSVELFFEKHTRKMRLSLKWLKDSRRGELPLPVDLVLSEYYSQKNSSSK